MIKKILYILLFSFCINYLNAKRIQKERVYQEYIANIFLGDIEIVLEDGTRVDILTEIFAIEVDFADKFYEGISQAIYYAIVTKSRPAIVLIVENKKRDMKYIKRAEIIINRLNEKGFQFKFWIIDLDKKIEEIL